MPKKLTKEEQWEIDNFWNRYESFLYWNQRNVGEAKKRWKEVMEVTRSLVERGIIRPGDRMPPQGR